MSRVWLDQSLILIGSDGILNVRNNLLEESRCGSTASCSATGLGLGGSILCSNLSKLLVVRSELLSVNFLLLGLGFLLLGLGAPLSDLLNVELVLSLQLVGFAAGAQETSEEEDGEEEAADGVPGESVRSDDSQREDTPPVESVGDPEGKEAGNNEENVRPAVLIDTLVVSLVNGVVAMTVAGDLGGFTLLRVRLNRSRLCCLHIYCCIFNVSQINKL